MSKVKKIAAAVAALVVVVAGVGVWSYASPWIALARIESALESHDEAALQALVDWQAVRDNMTIDLSKKALAQSNIQPGDERANELVMGIQNGVDKMVTPENLAALMTKLKAADLHMVVRGGYMSVGKYIFALQNSKSGGAMSLRLRRLGPVSWRLDEIAMIDPQSLAPSK